MTARSAASLKSVLLTGTAALFLGYPAVAPAADVSTTGIVVAQAAPDRQERQNREGRRERDGKPGGEQEEAREGDKPKQNPPAARSGAEAPQQKPADRGEKPAAQQERRDTRDERRAQPREERDGQPREDRAGGQRPQPQQQSSPPAAQDRRQQPATPPSTAQQPQRPEPPAARPSQTDRERAPGWQRQAPTAQPQPQQAPAAQQPQAPAAQDRRQPPATPPSTAQQPQRPEPPAAQQSQPDRERAPGWQRQAPAAQPQPQQAPAAAQGTSPTLVAPPTRTRDAREFIRRGGDAPTRGMDEVRRERRETREGDRIVIRESDRAIVREGGRTIIQHNESNRFAIGARDVRVDRRGGTVETVVDRGNGVRIVSVHDADGRLIRRVRRDRSGRDIVLIDNSFAGARAALFIQLAMPTIRMPRERYIVDMGRARPDDIYAVFLAPPVERLERRYTLDQVRYNPPLRAYMPRVDLDINFETGSWQITPDQIGRLEVIARGILRAIERNPLEVYMIEGHTDAVGSDEDNLSLSDRRAEAVAIALTEEFDVPPENLVTQGFGEQELKVDTQGPSRENRRVAVRRITPLLDQQVAGGRR
jgi:OmpA-OmpF porin, OOP family